MGLLLKFDPRCSIKDRYHGATGKGDELHLYLGDGTPICNPLSGNHWPSRPLMIHGHSIVLSFVSDKAKQKPWGYKITVIGLRMFWDTKMPKLVDLYRTVAHLHGKCIRSATIGQPVNEKEEAHSQWLDSPMFSQGTEEEVDATKSTPSWSPCVKHYVFLQDLAAQKEGSKALKLANHLESVKRIFQRKSPVVKRTKYIVIASLIKHLGWVEIADKFFSVPKELQVVHEEQLLRVWDLGNKIHQWIYTQRDTRLPEFETKWERFENRIEKEEEEFKKALADNPNLVVKEVEEEVQAKDDEA